MSSSNAVPAGNLQGAAPAGFTLVSAQHLQDATGTPVANATISFLPVANNGTPISFTSGGAAGQTVSQAVTTQVSGGAFALALADTQLTTPINVGYRVTVTDNVSGKVLLSTGYECIQPRGPYWSFDDCVPNLNAQITIQTGPAGPSAYQLYQAGGGTLSESAWLLSLIGTVASSLGLTITDTSGDSASLAFRSDLAVPAAYALLDLYQKIAFWIHENGDTYVSNNLVVEGMLSVLGTFSAGNLSAGTLNLGGGFTLDAGSADVDGDVLRITDGVRKSLGIGSDGKVKLGAGFVARLGGVISGGLAVDSLTINGLTPSAYPARPIRGIIGLGQSGAEGWASAPLLYTSASPYNFMFGPDGIDDIYVNSGTSGESAKTGLIPLQERLYNPAVSDSAGTQFQLGETGMTAMADALSKLSFAEEGVFSRWICSIAAQGGATIASMRTGTDVGNRFASQVAAGKTFGGPGFYVGYYFWQQGAGDGSPSGSDYNSPTYATDLATFVNEKNAVVLAATGQASSPITLILQENFVNNPYSNGPGSGGVMFQPYQEMIAARANPAIIKVLGPNYDLHNDVDSYPHPGGAAALRRGYRLARAIRCIERGEGWLPLSFAGAQRTGTLIRVDCNVPFGPLVIDTTHVQAIANYGLEYTDDGNAVITPAITGVYLVRPASAPALPYPQVAPQGKQIWITLSSDPGANTNSRVSAAWTWPSSGDVTMGTGARTNIRDSDCRMASYTPDLFNWLCHDRIAITPAAAAI